jgi:hypothetical protein
MKRFETFKEWKFNHDLSCQYEPTDMAQAGFFYCGVYDQVQCFDCAIILHNWPDKLSPFDEHLQWSPNCKYANIQKENPESLIEIWNNPAVIAVQYQFNNNKIIERAMRELFSNGILNPNAAVLMGKVLKLNQEIGFTKDEPINGLTKKKKKKKKKKQKNNLTLQNDEFTKDEPIKDVEFTKNEPINGLTKKKKKKKKKKQKNNLTLQNDEFTKDEPIKDVEFTKNEPINGLTKKKKKKKKKQKNNLTLQNVEFTKDEPINGLIKKQQKITTTLQDDKFIKIDLKTKRLITQLKEENMHLEEEYRCRFCPNAAEMVFLPCGHLIACFRCVKQRKECIKCNTSIRGIVRTYII